jgi:hypothetical protein
VRSMIIPSWIALTIASAADAGGHRRTHPAKPATQSAQADDKTAAEKAFADPDETFEKRIKSICCGC